MASIASIISRIRVAINDVAAATYTDSELQELLVNALDEYSLHIPIVNRGELDDWAAATIAETPDGVTYHANLLPDDYRTMIRVWSNVSGDDSRILYDSSNERIETLYTRKSHLDSDFVNGRYYDVIPATEYDNQHKIVIGTGLTSSGEFLSFIYLGANTITAATATSFDIGIPQQHNALIVAHVVAAIARRRAITEATSGTTGDTYEIGQAVREAERKYQKLLWHAIDKQPYYINQSVTVPITSPTRTGRDRWT